MGSDYLFSSGNSTQVSVEDEIRNHRLTDTNHAMISGGQDLDDNLFGLHQKKQLILEKVK